MYKRFNLDLQGKSNQEFIQNLKKYKEQGSNLFKIDRNIITNDLAKFQNMKGQLSGNQIIDEWFPDIKADIFLSHSHQDEDLVICLAGWLYKEFGLTSFIDSAVWGYSNRLLKIIDDKYSLSCNSNAKYDYNKRNYSTSHVHMMLSTSLMNMIDKCECIIFVNTSQSFTPADDIRNGSTISPWIFSEILMTKMLRIQMPPRLEIAMDSSIQASNESLDSSELLQICYDPSMKHLTPLSVSQLRAWQSKAKNGKEKNGKEKNLDILYQLTCNSREIIYG